MRYNSNTSKSAVYNHGYTNKPDSTQINNLIMLLGALRRKKKTNLEEVDEEFKEMTQWVKALAT